jgi:hypothetical protein
MFYIIFYQLANKTRHLLFAIKLFIYIIYGDRTIIAAFLGLLLTPRAIYSSVFPSSSFLLLPPAALSSDVSALLCHSTNITQPPYPLCFDMLHYTSILLCLYRSFISLFVFLRHPPSSVFVPLNIFLSIISLFFVSTQVSHPYIIYHRRPHHCPIYPDLRRSGDFCRRYQSL